jgi:membrane fusion protein (multidrug efflux system)
VALASIQQLDPIYVDVPQSTTDLLRLQRRLNSGQLIGGTAKAKEVTLVLPDGSHYTEIGTLQFRDVSVDPTTASVTLRMVFPNKNNVLLPGMFVRAMIEEGSNPEGILIPQQTVARDPKGNPLALVVKADGMVEQRTLKLDRAIGDQWLVSSGLTAGERIVMEGIQKVRPGMKVSVVTVPETNSKSAGTNQAAAAK